MEPTKPAKPTSTGHTVADAEFLPDEDVIDDVPEGGERSNVIFAGLSDAPPSHPIEPVGGGTPSAPRADLRISVIERRDSVRHFVVLVAVLAAIVASVFVRPRDAGRESVDGLASRSPRPAAGADSIAAPNAPGPGGAETVARPSASEASRAALEAKSASRAALAAGQALQAIEAGERSLGLDPTDAETWLILAAGYDQRGGHAEARRCFEGCVQFATRGPRGECSALLKR